MNHLLNFNQLFEKLQMVTSNWSIISNESSFEKKDDNGYLVFSKEGTFSIIYKKKSVQEESRMDFYSKKENSTDKKSICECKITTSSGMDRVKTGFPDINEKNIWEIIALFFDYSDIDKAKENSYDIFLMGFSKSIKEVQNSEEKDQLAPSFIIFCKCLKDAVKRSGEPNIPSKHYNLKNAVKKFVDNFKDNKKY